MTGTSRTALIIGAAGQDGTLLSRDLVAKGVRVVGVSRSGVSCSAGELGTEFAGFDILDSKAVLRLVGDVQPDEIYYLAAYHGSAEGNYSDIGLENYQKHAQVHVHGLLNFLSAMQSSSPESKLFYASSSLVFDGSTGPVQSEETPLTPIGYYGQTKAQGMLLCREFRERHGVFACSGILYNHESVLRADTFFSKKIIKGAHQISLGLQSELVVGNLQARTDWGYAPDYVEAFQRVLAADKPDDFIVASGEGHSVKEFADLVFDCFSLDAGDYLVQDPSLIGRKTVEKVGNIERIANWTGWKPKRSFEQMVRQLVEDYRQSLASEE